MIISSFFILFRIIILEVKEIKILFLWKIGRFINFYDKKTDNIVMMVSNYLSYYYGNSYKFSLSNVNLMKKLYMYFPIYTTFIEKLDWNLLKKILILNKKECYFYFRIVLLCHSKPYELERLINTNIYFRI